MNRHLKDQQLLEILYGISDKTLHLLNCNWCTRRLRALELRRAELALPEPVSSEFLAAQRRRIYSRIGERRASTRKWVPAFAAAFLLGIGLLFYKPSPAPPPPPHPDIADAQLFSDVYSMEQLSDPPAAAPIHALFEDSQ